MINWTLITSSIISMITGSVITCLIVYKFKGKLIQQQTDIHSLLLKQELEHYDKLHEKYCDIQKDITGLINSRFEQQKNFFDKRFNEIVVSNDKQTKNTSC